MTSSPLLPPDPPNPQRSDSVEIVEAIVGAGRELAAAGIQNMTMRGVAKRAGVGVASLYRYFPDRGALLTEIFRRQHHETLQALKESLRDNPSIEVGIRKCIQSFIDFDEQEVALRRALNFDVPLGWSIGELVPVLEQARGQLVTWLCVQLPELPVVEAERRIFFGLALARGTVMLRLQQPDKAPPSADIVDTVSALVIDILNGSRA